MASHALLSALLLAVGTATDEPLWTGGGVTLDANYSYSTTALGGAPGLTGGGFAISCGTLTPTGHSFGRAAGLRAAPSSVTVHLVAANGSCSGTKVDATFTAIPASAGLPGASPRCNSLCNTPTWTRGPRFYVEGRGGSPA